MKKLLIGFLITFFTLVSTAGCSVTTKGEANWEVYLGVRTQQVSQEPAKVSLGSSVVDKIVESMSEAEVNSWLGIVATGIKLYMSL